jgi:uncharacterized C2H2 Zn-finger protein
MDELQCLYCERIFRDHASFRAHLRKKRHYKINPRDKRFDKFYIINYVRIVQDAILSLHATRPPSPAAQEMR